MRVGRVDFEQFWALFKRFIEFHREHLYPPELVPLLYYDEDTLRRQMEDMIRRAETDDSIFVKFVWDGNRMIAFGVATIGDYWAGGKVLDIDSIYVDDNHRGKGIGTQILQEILKWARTQGVRVVSVHVALQNERMLRLLEKFGFSPFNLELRKNLEE